MSKKIRLKNLFDGSLIMNHVVLNNWAYMLFLVALGILFIANNYVSERIIRETNKRKSEIKSLQTEYISVYSEMLRLGQQSHVALKLDTLGIVESTVPPKQIRIPNESHE